MGDYGSRRLAERYLLTSPIFGYTGVFAEIHPHPETAVSDGDCQIELARLPGLLNRFDAIVASANADSVATVLGESGMAVAAGEGSLPVWNPSEHPTYHLASWPHWMTFT